MDLLLLGAKYRILPLLGTKTAKIQEDGIVDRATVAQRFAQGKQQDEKDPVSFVGRLAWNTSPVGEDDRSGKCPLSMGRLQNLGDFGLGLEADQGLISVGAFATIRGLIWLRSLGKSTDEDADLRRGP